MKQAAIRSIRAQLVNTIAHTQSVSCAFDFDDGDASSLIGFVEDAETLPELCQAMTEWLHSLEQNNREEEEF